MAHARQSSRFDLKTLAVGMQKRIKRETKDMHLYREPWLLLCFLNCEAADVEVSADLINDPGDISHIPAGQDIGAGKKNVQLPQT